MSPVKKIKLCLLALPFFLNAKAQDSAQQIVKKNLDVIESFVNEKYPKKPFVGWSSVSFLTKLTGIPSSTGGDYGGSLPPDSQDLNYWKVWYNLNKDNIYWDNKLKVIVLHKQIDPNR
jgi:hypothetical protein